MRRTPQFTNIRTEGGLLPSDLLGRVASLDTDLDAVSAEDYHLAAGERITEAIDRSWNRLVGAWEVFAQTIGGLTSDDRTATEPTRRRWSLVLFQELGYGQLQIAKAAEIGGKSYPISHLWGAVPVHLVGVCVELDHRTPGVAGASTMSPHGLVQEFLNRSDEHLWGFVSNGLRLRLLRDNAALTRQAFVEFDLEAIFTGQAYADFVVLWLLCHESRLEGEPLEKCVLERWMSDAAQQGTRALDQLRIGVEAAITALGEGFLVHRENGSLRRRLRAGELNTQDYYRQLLRLVYRLIFLSVAEDRELLLDPAAEPTSRERYVHYYALGRVRRLAEARRGGAHPDVWAGLRVVFGGLGSPSGLPELALPPLGSFLWSGRACPDLDPCSLSNRHLLAAVRALTSVRDGNILRSVDYRNLGSEELGSIYESLLELHPQLSVDGAAFSLASAPGNERKTTGSYYTPTSLINELLNSALDPVLDEAAAADDPQAAILALTVLDPACGSGHFLIAAAHRIAKRLASVRTGDGEPSPPEIHRALRDVISESVYGIDVNEMAVELCKVSLWMETMEPGKPLSFLDHRIAHGNSLLGTTPLLLAEGVPDAAFKPLQGDEKSIVASLKKRNRQEREGQGALIFGPRADDLLPAIAAEMHVIDAMPEETVSEVEAKERRWLALQHSSELGKAQLSADAWCAAFVCRKVAGAPVVTESFVRQAASHDRWQLDSETVEEVLRLRDQYRFLHLHLAFPDVFKAEAEETDAVSGAGPAGGFDVVLGNPPWERVKLQEKEWFAERAPEISTAKSAAIRRRMIVGLRSESPGLYEDFLAASREAEGESHFLRSSGRYPLCGRGDVNTYAVFAEMMRSASSARGSVGVIVPSGIATDDTTKFFFSDVVTDRSLVSLFDFINDSGLFPGVGHGRQKFCLLTMAGGRRSVERAEFVFFASSPSDVHDTFRRFSLSDADFALLNPNTLTCPVFRSGRDADLTKSIYERVPVMSLDEGRISPWGVSFQRMFDMTNDSHLFSTSSELDLSEFVRVGNRYISDVEEYFPLYESKMFHQFTHRWGDFTMRAEGSLDSQLPDVPAELLRDPRYVVHPRYWVRAAELKNRLERPAEFVLGLRNICRNTDVRTCIAAVLPATAVGNNAPLMWLGDHQWASVDAFIANLSSFALDYVVRQKLGGTQLNFFIARQLPVLPPATFAKHPSWCPTQTVGNWLRERVLELVFTAVDLEGFARHLGHTQAPFVWDEARRELLRAEVDAAFFHLYEIERDDADYMMETFPIVKRKDLAVHGEYRTKRLILEVYDMMAKASETGEAYQTVLDPGPADPRLVHEMR